MKTSAYLDAVRVKLGLPSDYALIKPLSLSRQQLSRYRKDQDFFSDEVAIRVAGILQIPAGKVLLDMHLERSKTPEVRAAWGGLMEKFSTSFRNSLLGRTPHVAMRW